MNNAAYKRLIVLNLFTSGHCTITHIALAMALSYITSNSVYVFTFFTGLYLMSMGMGVLFVENIHLKSNRLTNLILLNSMAGIILANPGITGIITANELGRFLLRAYHIDLLFLMFPAGIILTVLIGMVSGAEIPVFSKLIEKENGHTSKPIIGVLTSDYFGAFAGIMAFTFLLNPFTGLLNGIFISQVITLIIIDYTFYKLKASKKLLPLLFILNIYVLILFLLRMPFANFIDGISAF